MANAQKNNDDELGHLADLNVRIRECEGVWHFGCSIYQCFHCCNDLVSFKRVCVCVVSV